MSVPVAARVTSSPNSRAEFASTNGNSTRQAIYFARRAAFFGRAFAFTVDLRAARLTVRVVFTFAAFAGRDTFV